MLIKSKGIFRMRTITELIDLRGRTALITGATGGIGQEAALTIAELGGDLILVDQPDSNYDQIKQNILDKWSVYIKCIDCDL
jgi:short-subunit dehydrogenase